jgi:hypothetical protein
MAWGHIGAYNSVISEFFKRAVCINRVKITVKREQKKVEHMNGSISRITGVGLYSFDQVPD